MNSKTIIEKKINTITDIIGYRIAPYNDDFILNEMKEAGFNYLKFHDIQVAELTNTLISSFINIIICSNISKQMFPKLFAQSKTFNSKNTKLYDIDGEITSGVYDPITISDRLRALDSGQIPSVVYQLLRINHRDNKESLEGSADEIEQYYIKHIDDYLKFHNNIAREAFEKNRWKNEENTNDVAYKDLKKNSIEFEVRSNKLRRDAVDKRLERNDELVLMLKYLFFNLNKN